MKDSKDVFNEAYYEAIEEGLPEQEAAALASERLAGWSADKVDEAYERYRDR